MRLLGIFGNPIGHSLSPVMHNTLFKKLGMDCIYLPFEVKQSYLKEAIRAIKALDILGVNITIPYKERVVEFVDELSKEAESVGAVNTIVNREGRLVGFNTDIEGFLNSLKKFDINLDNMDIMLLGAGGAAKAVAYAISLYNHNIRQLFIANRTKARAEGLISQIIPQFENKALAIELSEIPEYLPDRGIIINATPVDNDFLFDYSLLEGRDVVVYDLIYNPCQSLLIKYAKKYKKLAINGIYMLIYQGIEAFKLWTGIYPPIEVIEERLKDYIIS